MNRRPGTCPQRRVPGGTHSLLTTPRIVSNGAKLTHFDMSWIALLRALLEGLPVKNLAAPIVLTMRKMMVSQALPTSRKFGIRHRRAHQWRKRHVLEHRHEGHSLLSTHCTAWYRRQCLSPLKRCQNHRAVLTPSLVRKKMLDHDRVPSSVVEPMICKIYEKSDWPSHLDRNRRWRRHERRGLVLDPQDKLSALTLARLILGKR